MFGLGYTLFDLGRHREAYTHLRRYSELAPHNSWAWLWLGRAARGARRARRGRAAPTAPPSGASARARSARTPPQRLRDLERRAAARSRARRDSRPDAPSSGGRSVVAARRARGACRGARIDARPVTRCRAPSPGNPADAPRRDADRGLPLRRRASDCTPTQAAPRRRRASPPGSTSNAAGVSWGTYRCEKWGKRPGLAARRGPRARLAPRRDRPRADAARGRAARPAAARARQARRAAGARAPHGRRGDHLGLRLLVAVGDDRVLRRAASASTSNGRASTRASTATQAHRDHVHIGLTRQRRRSAGRPSGRVLGNGDHWGAHPMGRNPARRRCST